MGEFLTSIASLLEQANARVELAAHNIANISTPGFKRHVHFRELLAPDAPVRAEHARASEVSDLTQGPHIETGAPLDLALSGPGFFVVRSEDGLRYTRAGKFNRNADGRVGNGAGAILQLAGGADLTLSSQTVRIHEDGTVVDGEAPLGRLWIVSFDESQTLARDGSEFLAPEGAAFDAEGARVRQGALEASNVSNAAEMLAIMEAVRQAEAGQRLMHVYDQALSRTLTVLGQSS